MGTPSRGAGGFRCATGVPVHHSAGRTHLTTTHPGDEKRPPPGRPLAPGAGPGLNSGWEAPLSGGVVMRARTVTAVVLVGAVGFLATAAGGQPAGQPPGGKAGVPPPVAPKVPEPKRPDVK